MRTYGLVGVCLTLFCLVFTLIYEHFSHGAYSMHMRCMMLIPLVGCDFLGQICYCTGLWKYVGRGCFNLWNCGLATIMVGLLFRGIVNISGRNTTADTGYYIAGGCLLGLALLVCVIENLIARRTTHDNL